MSAFAQSLCQAQILILEILNVFLWLKFSPSWTLNKIERFETVSQGSIVINLYRNLKLEIRDNAKIFKIPMT